jgi:hypothetical protein
MADVGSEITVDVTVAYDALDRLRCELALLEALMGRAPLLPPE